LVAANLALLDVFSHQSFSAADCIGSPRWAEMQQKREQKVLLHDLRMRCKRIIFLNLDA
jgi:hypothetical protein